MGTGTDGLTNCLTFKARTEDYSSSATSSASETYTAVRTRQPEVQGRVFTVFIMGSAFGEALALIGFVVALIVK